MKRKIWAGNLPRYWVDSPWWAGHAGDLFLLVPGQQGRSLLRLTTEGEVVWEEPVVSNVLLACEDGVVVTARVRDGRSHAVYYAFGARDVASGRILWELPSDVSAYRPKSGLPHFPVVHGAEHLIHLDQWRTLRQGRHSDVTIASGPRGEWRIGATCISEGFGGLVVQGQGSTWSSPDLAMADILGVKGNLLIGKDPGKAFWARDLHTGALRWRLGYDDFGVIVPSERIAGLADEYWQVAETVPVAAVLWGDGLSFLSEDSQETWLVNWPGGTIVERWAQPGNVVFLGALANGLLVLEESDDGMGYLWFVK